MKKQKFGQDLLDQIATNRTIKQVIERMDRSERQSIVDFDNQ